jgi:two-component system chemotaxis response regulator CheB
MPTVLIVDDSAFARLVLAEGWRGLGWVPVAAESGHRARALLSAVRPDLVTMDVEMPEMDGVEATALLRGSGYGGPILMLSGATARQARITLEALAAGADDFVEKPSDGPGLARVVEDLQGRWRALTDGQRPSLLPTPEEEVRTGPLEAVCVVASTGGPLAVGELLTDLPRGALPVVVVQHMPQGFTAAFAQRLARLSGRRVVEAPDDGRLLPWGEAEVLVAPGGRHLRLTSAGAFSEEGPRHHGVAPAADVTLADAALLFGNRLGVVVLTGIGSDGAAGARAAHDRGAVVLAESPETAAVWGMPRAALLAGAVDAVWGLPHLREWLRAALRRSLRDREAAPRGRGGEGAGG